MKEIPTRNEILKGSSEGGLLAYLFDIAEGYSLYRESKFLTDVAEIVGSGERTLFSEKDWEFLDGMKGQGPAIYTSIHLLCKLIPFLDVGHRDLMRLVKKLVDLGGEYGFAYEPNVAFRKWCSVYPERVKAVLEEAEAGDGLAIDHLCFALEAQSESAVALRFLTKDQTPETQLPAAVALGRMTLDADSEAMVLRSLLKVVIGTDDSSLKFNALSSSFAILEKNPELRIEDIKHGLRKVISDTSSETLDRLSILIWSHGRSLGEDEVRLIFDALKSVNPENVGTLTKIDNATSALVDGGHFKALSGLIAELIRRSQGKIRFDTFPSFCRKLVDDDSRRLGKLIISWLLEGDPFLCSSLAQQFGKVAGKSQALDLHLDDLPEEPEEQLFICRKAVGFWFHSPVTAASVLVAVLRHGDDQIFQDVLELLYDPLLISYGDNLCHYLEEIMEQCTEPGIARIREVLNRKKKYLDSLEGIETLVELHPSEIHRQIEHVRFNRKVDKAWEKAEKKSIFYDTVTKQNILYGNAVQSYNQDMEGPDGEPISCNMNLVPHSVSTEFPQLFIFDPEGLQIMVMEFRLEKKTRP